MFDVSSDRSEPPGRAYGFQLGAIPVTPGRRRNMQAIKRRDTKPELALRRLLHARGLRYRVDMRLDLGEVKPRPDIVFTRAKIAVFVDGCYWHQCPHHGRQPEVNAAYWGPKLQGNVDRDRRYDLALEAAGWVVVRAWEHEDPLAVAERVVLMVGPPDAARLRESVRDQRITQT